VLDCSKSFTRNNWKERCGELERERKEEGKTLLKSPRPFEVGLKRSRARKNGEEEMSESQEVKKLFCGDIEENEKDLFSNPFHKRVKSEIISKVENICSYSQS
jgi:hypothetical protein